ncbi:hypothetical protein BDY19DRAFT_886393 [Irpex rosettiformis]|uniref:Uncharacterized protein n=1 Tax=Irpex rosettiformis TaxID=378272 RepID=A0ACB8UAQ9_9APHY|nr:hypothetical protein BDY19DRAFT_886393 [Irpex rosettiformis]
MLHNCSGACERCKGLKVKCEFKPGFDVCKRCSNGNHECKIPGRKKRRAPPKREHLLSQIRDQTEKIEKLMAELEAANRKVEAARATAIPLDAPSPSQSTESYSFASSGLASPEVGSVSENGTLGGTKTKADVMDWIAKARESIEAFSGYISIGGPGATREMLATEDDGSDHGSPINNEDDGTFEIDVVDAEDDIDGGGAGVSGDEGSVHTSRRAGSEAPTRQERLATIPSVAAPLGLLADLSLGTKGVRRRTSRSSMGEDDGNEDLGLANMDYFRPSPAIERPLVQDHQPPHILRSGLITVVEVEKLFDIYWKYMNCSVSLLDPALYSAQQAYWRSPFLFTVVCGIASRFYAERPELYQRAMEFARLAAGTALIGGQKSVESVHAYILLALYPVPAKKWEDDRGWIYLGVAIRIATDLNLHYPNTAKPKDERHAREMLNRTRAWLNCFNLDRSTGSQYGKAPIISNTDYVASHSQEWWNSSPFNLRGFDIQLAAYNAELKLMGLFRAKIHSDPNSPTGFNKNIDLAVLAAETDDQLARLWEQWLNLLRENTDPSDVLSNFRNRLLRLAYSYARMSVLSFGFQYAFGKTSVGQDVTLLWRCMRAAFDVTNAILENITYPDHRVYLRHGPEAQSVFVTFACAFLLKLLQPRYASYVSREQRVEIRDKVQKVADLFGSPEVAVDDRHGPKLYSSFLKNLLAAPFAQVDRPLIQKRTSAKSKSVSPTSQKTELLEDTKMGVSSVPVTPALPRPSMSPLIPNVQPIAGPINADSPEVVAGLGMEMNVPDYFAPPLPFDSELLDSMTWPDMAIPGTYLFFAIMSILTQHLSYRFRMDGLISANRHSSAIIDSFNLYHIIFSLSCVGFSMHSRI